jgi:hypothetical protein
MMAASRNPSDDPVDGPYVVTDQREARDALGRLVLYRKLASWLLLYVSGLPTLDGVIATAWNRRTSEAIASFAGRLGGDQLLIRSDTENEDARSPRGGYLVGLEDIEREAKRFLERDRVVYFLEPRSPFDDLYSISLAPSTGWEDWSLEVVGPGFDASDLKRGDVTPHEIFRATRMPAGFRYEREHLVSPLEYAASRSIRMEKVGRLLARASHETYAGPIDPDDAARELGRRGETLLLDATAYVPITDALLERALAYAERVRPSVDAYRAPAISMSFIGRAADPIFWDIVWPDTKYIVGQPASPLE